MFSWKNRKVAITGATGFLGYHTALELCRQGAEVSALVRGSSDVQFLAKAGIAHRLAEFDQSSALRNALAGCDLVIHVAGAVGFGNQWKKYHQANVGGTQNLLNAAQQAGARRFVHTSSIVAVGAATTPTALDESAEWNLKPFHVPYVTTKRQAEEAALAANGPELEVVVVNPASVVGPDDFTGSEFGTLCRRFWKKRIPFHFGGGNNFVDVRDVAAGICLAAEHGRAGERYLLTGENRSYSEFFRDLSQVAGTFIPRLRLPRSFARLIGYVNDKLQTGESKRSYLSSAQASLMGLYFFYETNKACAELGYRTRPLMRTLADTHAFWMGPAAKATPLAA